MRQQDVSTEKIQTTTYQWCQERTSWVQLCHCKPSYASVVAPSDVTKNKEKSFDYCLVVDSDNCSSEDVKKIIKAKINPAESKLGVCDMEKYQRKQTAR
ncbi:hypothetical protein TNCV_4676301 [Trichonephila clavipes]|nr:hypothetical protein TNCV_4676301 [Trichonephila clavipes]